MKIYLTLAGPIVEYNDAWHLFPSRNWNEFINRKKLYQTILGELSSSETISSMDESQIMAPIDLQEVWASGVTYYKSREARMEESADAGGGDFYDRVYYADRPELFFKANKRRVSGNGEALYIRRDSTWDVPEPELTLFINSAGTIEGYTIGNDMSSRSIEGENPLYLPQAKTYAKCAGLGPCIYVTESPLPSDTPIRLVISRKGKAVFNDEITLAQLKRDPKELVEYLYRETDFPDGCFLMTGTGIVPPNEFTLQPGDEVEIEIGPIGRLRNTISYK